MIKIKKSRKGSLHKALKIKEDHKIPTKTIDEKLRKAKKDKDKTLEKKLVFAKNARKWKRM